MSNKTVQRLLQESRRGHPIDSDMLREMGVSAALAAYMVKSGWLQRLSQGVYLLTGDMPSRDGSIAYLGQCIPGLHVGGKTALAWQGYATISPSGNRSSYGGRSRTAFLRGWRST